MELEVTVRQDSGWTIVEPCGEIDVYTTPFLREKLIEAIARDGSKIAVSLERVEFIDSTGLGVLVSGLKRARHAHSRFEVICQDERHLKILRVTGLDRVFTIRPSIEVLRYEAASGAPLQASLSN